MTANNTLEKKQGEEHVKRPPNKFLCYRSETLENEFKGVKVQMKLFSRTIGQRWNAMSKEAQAPYAKRAEQLRKEHAEKYPDYKYNPKRGQKTKQRAADEQLTGGVQAPRKQGRRRVRFPSGTSQDVSNSHKVAAVRTAARSRRAAKASNTYALH
ncbi:hypothetical protein C8Q70DRAFT_259922 [Cubamyces menziesii]|nr:hypothetical protein C8Q70DRAFT_259922 [Cubamyces menziesii]